MTDTPLTTKQARALDAKIRTTGDRLRTLVEQAAAGGIHDALNCSWRTWWNDAPRPAIDALVAMNRERKAAS
jgi:hypothetical protein